MLVDIFGMSMRDYWLGLTQDGYTTVRDDGCRNDKLDTVSQYFWPYEKWPDADKFIIDNVQGEVLDVGAGAGRHSLELEKRGYKVCATDSSLAAIEIMKELGLKDVQQLDMFEPILPNRTFDTIIMMFNVFSMVGSPEKARKTLMLYHKLSRPHTRIGVSLTNFSAAGQPIHQSYRERNHQLGRPLNQIRFRLEYKDMVSEWLDLLLISPDELADLVQGTGWTLESFKEMENGYYGAFLERVL